MLTDRAHRELAQASHLFLTTAGRAGCTQTVELWFACDGDTAYVLSTRGAAADWVRNIDREPRVEVRIGRLTRAGHARRITDPDEAARAHRLIVCKYQPRSAPSWGTSTLPLAIDLDEELAVLPSRAFGHTARISGSV